MKFNSTSVGTKLVQLLTFALVAVAAVAAQAAPVSSGSPLPEFTHPDGLDWLNSAPLSVSGLRGSVVLVDFWALGCWNCYQTIPWLNDIEARYASKGLVVVSVHTPELEPERVRQNVVEAAQHYHLTNPIMLDNDYSYWNALQNQAWPAFYLADRKGRLRLAAAGEVHIGDDNAHNIEAMIERLLAEPAEGK